MSRKPHPEGVTEFRETLARFNEINKEFAQLSDAVTRLTIVTRVREETYRKLLKQMEEMEISSSGNTGWDERIIWFLSELDRQASKRKT
jgi:hypothetical protein